MRSREFVGGITMVDERFICFFYGSERNDFNGFSNQFISSDSSKPPDHTFLVLSTLVIQLNLILTSSFIIISLEKH